MRADREVAGWLWHGETGGPRYLADCSHGTRGKGRPGEGVARCNLAASGGIRWWCGRDGRQLKQEGGGGGGVELVVGGNSSSSSSSSSKRSKLAKHLTEQQARSKQAAE